MVEQPEYLTVPEVMERLRLGRTTVYEQARLWLATGGAEGLPCRRFGRLLRFPAASPRPGHVLPRHGRNGRPRHRRPHAGHLGAQADPTHSRHADHNRNPSTPGTPHRRPAHAPLHRLTPMRLPPLVPKAMTKNGDALAPAVQCRPVRRNPIRAVRRC